MLARVAAGETEAFRGLVDRHLPTVLAIARRMLRDDAEAEDVAQETLLRLMAQRRGAGARSPRRAAVAAAGGLEFVYRPGARAPQHHGRGDGAGGERAGRRRCDSWPSVSSAHAWMRRCKALPDRQRLALTLFHYEGMSQIEVGEVLGISDEAVESLLARARRTLKGALKEEWRGLMPEGEI